MVQSAIATSPLDLPVRRGGSGFGPWTVAAAATAGMAAAYGGISTIGVLIGPFQSEFGWLKADISLAYVLLTVGIAVGGLLVGRMADVLPTGPIAAAGVVVLGLGFTILSLQSSVRTMQMTYLAMGFLGFSSLYSPLLTTVSLWFKHGHGLALGVVTAGGALGQAAVPPVFQWLVLEFGWRNASVLLGVGYIILLAPILLLVRKPWADAGGPSMEHAADSSAWNISPPLAVTLLGAAGLSCCALMGMPTVHLVSYSISVGLEAPVAASVMTVTMLAGAFGRIATGLIVDRTGSLRAYAIVSAVQTVAVYCFAGAEGLWPLYVVGAVYGFGFGGVMTGLVCAVRDAVPQRFLGTSMALVGMLAWAGMAAGGYQGGLCFDLTGSYDLSFGLAAAAGVINLACLATLELLIRRGRKCRT